MSVAEALCSLQTILRRPFFCVSFFFLKSILIRASDESPSGGRCSPLSPKPLLGRLPHTLPPIQLDYWIYFFNQIRVSPPFSFSSHTQMPACLASNKGKCVKPGLLIRAEWACLCSHVDHIPKHQKTAARGPFSSGAHDVFHSPRSEPWQQCLSFLMA